MGYALFVYLFIFFKFYFIFKLYTTVLVLPNRGSGLNAGGRWELVVAVKSMELGDYGTIDCGAGRK